jgi:hypothetical protein
MSLGATAVAKPLKAFPQKKQGDLGACQSCDVPLEPRYCCIRYQAWLLTAVYEQTAYLSNACKEENVAPRHLTAPHIHAPAALTGLNMSSGMLG